MISMTSATRLAAIVAASMVLVMAGCAGPGGTGGPNVESISLKAREFAFEPSQIKVAASGAIAITLDNAGVVDHDLVIEGAQGKLLVPAGKSGMATFKLPKAGTYTYACSVAGHKDAGMKGTLTVG